MVFSPNFSILFSTLEAIFTTAKNPRILKKKPFDFYDDGTGPEPYRLCQPATEVTKAPRRSYPADWVQVATAAVAVITAMALARLVRPPRPAVLFIRIPIVIRSFRAISTTISRCVKPVRRAEMAVDCR